MTNQEQLEAVNKQIEELSVKQAELEMAIEQEKKAQEQAKSQEREDALNAIKESIKLFNETYNDSLAIGYTSVTKGVGRDAWRKMFYGTPFEDLV